MANCHETKQTLGKNRREQDDIKHICICGDMVRVLTAFNFWKGQTRICNTLVFHPDATQICLFAFRNPFEAIKIVFWLK